MKNREWFEWSNGTDSASVYKRAGGRRRYNAMRQRKAETRRDTIARMFRAEWLLHLRGIAPQLAVMLGVSRQTAWRDLQAVLFGPREYRYHNREGEHQFSIFREYPGGRIIGLCGSDGEEIHGQEKQRQLRGILRCLGR